MRVGIDISKQTMNGPYLAAVQIAAPGGLTFVAQPTDRSGRLHEDWLHFLSDNRVVKVMIAAGQDRVAVRNTYILNHTGIDLTWQQGIFDLQAIYYWPELKRGGQLSALEIGQIGMGILYRGDSVSPKAYKEAQQRASWMPPEAYMTPLKRTIGLWRIRFDSCVECLSYVGSVQTRICVLIEKSGQTEPTPNGLGKTSCKFSPQNAFLA